MGRILRKKPASLKKKRKQDASQVLEDSANQQAEAGVKSAVAVRQETTMEEKRKPALTSKKSLAPPAPVQVSPPPDNVFTRAVQFLREVKTELKKVTWPTRKQTMGSTLVVIVLVMIISVFLGIVDMGLSTLVRFVFN
jgi:preprotein translocase subunit SecE